MDFKKPMLSALAFFGMLGALSVGYAAFSAVANNKSQGMTLSSLEWNTMANDLSDLDLRLSNFVFSSGNVGIGATPALSSGSGLQVHASGAGPSSLHLTTGNQGAGASNGLDVRFSAGDGNIWNYGNGYLGFATNNAERMRIDPSGNLLVGKTVGGMTANGVQITPGGMVTQVFNFASPNQALTFNNNNASGVGYTIDFRQNNVSVGSISVGSSSTGYGQTSDYRLKTDVKTMTGALDRIMALHPDTYRWKVDGSYGEGFLAHELQEVVPYAVNGKKDAVDADGKPVYQSVDYGRLTPVLAAGVQELVRKNEADERKMADQAAEIDQLKTQNADFEARLQKLENP
jgi:hypothetical protein